jgi:Tol biopolymer transport system component
MKQTAMMKRLTVFVGAVLVAMLVAVGLMAVERTKPAQAAFPGVNGKIAYPRGWEIYVIDPTTGVKTNLTNNSVLDAIPAFSADGKKIAFTSNRDGDYDIWVMDADGSNQTNLTSNSNATDADPAFSSDGSKIAFESHRGGDRAIYVMNAADGSSPTRLTTNINGDDPVFSPDGKKIAFESAQPPLGKISLPTRSTLWMPWTAMVTAMATTRSTSRITR